MARGTQQGDWGGLALVAAGFVLVATTAAGALVGYLLDRAFGTAPVWMVVGLLVGFVVGIWDLYRIAMVVMNRQPVPPPTKRQEWFEEESEEPAGDRDERHES